MAKKKPELIADRIAAQEIEDHITRGMAKYATDLKSWLVYDGNSGLYVLDGIEPLKAMVYKLANSRKNKADLLYHKDQEKRGKEYFSAAIALSSATKNSNIVKAMQSLPSVMTTMEVFDIDPLMFNVGNCTLEFPIKSGELVKVLPHSSAYKITKGTAVDYDPDAACPRWIEFMDEIHDGDTAVIEYMQMRSGYALTGLNTAQHFLMHHGFGANGKTIRRKVVHELMGSYATTIESGDLALNRNKNHKTLNSSLLGARVLASSEIAEGDRLDEKWVKDLTGGDPVKCRYLYGRDFDAVLFGKLESYGNHLPRIKGRDLGIWRRVLVVPYNQHFGPQKADVNLMDKLREEYSGILNWFIEGYYKFLEHGLNDIPETIADASKDYREQQDFMQRFIDLAITPALWGKTPAANVTAVFNHWVVDIEKWDIQKTFASKWVCRQLRNKGIIIEPDSSNGNITSLVDQVLSKEGLEILEKLSKNGS